MLTDLQLPTKGKKQDIMKMIKEVGDKAMDELAKEHKKSSNTGPFTDLPTKE